MRHVSPSFTSVGLTALSALGLLGCGTNTVDPPDPTTIHHYRVRSIDLPVNSDEARSFGFDLDGAGAPVDNQLGNAHAVLVEFDSYYQVEGPAAARLESDVAWI